MLTLQAVGCMPCSQILRTPLGKRMPLATKQNTASLTSHRVAISDSKPHNATGWNYHGLKPTTNTKYLLLRRQTQSLDMHRLVGPTPTAQNTTGLFPETLPPVPAGTLLSRLRRRLCRGARGNQGQGRLVGCLLLLALRILA